MSEYLLDREDSTFQEAALRKEKTFLLYTAGFSGIQKFIYTVSTDGALKSLRSRSFFLELLMEHYVDELLAACQLSRSICCSTAAGNAICFSRRLRRLRKL